MIKTRSNIVAAAALVMMAVGSSATSAAAATVDLQPNAGNSNPVNAVLGSLLSTAGKTAAAAVPGPATFKFDLATAPQTIKSNDTIVATLSGGAKFDPTSLNTQLPSLLIGGAAASPSISLSGNAADSCKLSSGNTVFTCTLTSSSSNTQYYGIDLSNLKYDISAITGDVTVSVVHNSNLLGAAQVTASTATTAQTNEGLLFRGMSAVSGASASTKGVVGNVKTETITVTSSFKKFASGTNNVSVTSNAGTDFDLAYATNGASAHGNYLFTLSGLPAGVTKVTAVGYALTASDSTGSTTNISATNGGTFYITGTTATAMTAASGVAARIPQFDIVVDGTTPNATTDVTLTITYLPATSDNVVQHTVLASSKIISLTRNGSTFRLNRVVSGSSLRLTNLDTGTAGGAITITAYDKAGTALTNAGTVALPTTVAPGGNSVDILGSDLITDFGATIDHVIVTVEAAKVEGSLTHAITGLGFSTTVGTTGDTTVGNSVSGGKTTTTARTTVDL